MEKFRFFGFSFVALMGMVFLFNFILHYPVRSEMSEDDRVMLGKKFGKKAVDIEEDINKAPHTYEEIVAQLNKIPRFRPPQNNHLTEEQVHKYYHVVNHCWERFRSYRRNYLKQIQGIGRGVAIFAQGSTLLGLCQIEGMGEVEMTEEEFDWVKQRMFEVALFAVSEKIKSGQVQAEEKDQLLMARDQLCRVLDFYKETDKIEYFPEKLDPSRIPRWNVELFLRVKNEFRYRKINFENIKFDSQDISRAAQDLPE